MGPLELGTMLHNKYRIVRLLAETGGAVLYEATDVVHTQRVWVKILPRESLLNTDVMERFQREASSAKVLDVGKNADGLPYMVAMDPDVAPKPPVPKRPPVSAPTKKPSTTLIGVAPPAASAPPAPRLPAPAPSKTPPKPSDAVLALDDLDVQSVREPPPAPAPLPLFKPPPHEQAAAPHLTPNKTEPSKTEAPYLAPSKTEPASKTEAPYLAPSKTEPPSKTEAPYLAPSKTEKRSTALMWVLIPLVATMTGLGGWYMGRRAPREDAPPPHAQAPATMTTHAAEPATPNEPVASEKEHTPLETATTAALEPDPKPTSTARPQAKPRTESQHEAKAPATTTRSPARKPPPAAPSDPLTL